MVHPNKRGLLGLGLVFVLPELAKGLTRTEEERQAVLELLTKGTEHVRTLLADQGLADDVAVAAAFLASQLWSVARERELSEQASDALHAQLASTLGGPAVAALSDADKQRYWEYCIGLPVFVTGMREVATDPSAQADLRTIAAAAFKDVMGVLPDAVEIGEKGLTAAVPKKSATAKPAPTTKVDGIAYQAPAGWKREDLGWATAYRATLVDVDASGAPERNSERRHAASIFVLPPRSAPQGAAALFEPLWREQFGTFVLGDTVVAYRGRLACGLVVHYMGRWFERQGADGDDRGVYGVLYLVDLGGRVQPMTATVVPGIERYSMLALDRNAAYQSFVRPFDGFLKSVRPASGKAPHPTGGLFGPAEIQGDWARSSSAFGGMYVSTVTGQTAGAAVSSSSSRFKLGRDGTFVYDFGGYTSQPGYGGTVTTDKNDGTYVLDGDIVRCTPRVPRSYRYDMCAVGAGRTVTPQGPRRMLVMVAPNGRGEFIAPPLIPVADSYEGVMNWYVEEVGAGR